MHKPSLISRIFLRIAKSLNWKVTFPFIISYQDGKFTYCKHQPSNLTKYQDLDDFLDHIYYDKKTEPAYLVMHGTDFLDVSTQVSQLISKDSYEPDELDPILRSMVRVFLTGRTSVLTIS